MLSWGWAWGIGGSFGIGRGKGWSGDFQTEGEGWTGGISIITWTEPMNEYAKISNLPIYVQ